MSIDDDGFVHLAFDRAGVALWVIDNSGRLLHTNAAFRELFGWSSDDAIDISQISPPEDRAWTHARIERLVSGDDDQFHSLKRFVRRDGSEFRERRDRRDSREKPR